MEKNKQFVNEDTYQTLTELKTEPQAHEKAIMPLWKSGEKKNKGSLFNFCSDSSA